MRMRACPQVVDKLDFSSWDVVAIDVAAEVGGASSQGNLGPDGSGLGVLLCTMAQQSLEAVGMDDTVTEQEKLQRAESGLLR